MPSCECWHSHDGIRGGFLRETDFPSYKLIGLDMLGFAGESGFGPYVVEKADLFVGIVRRSVGEEVCDAAQRLDAARDGAMRQRGLQLIEQVIGGQGGFRTHGLYLCPGGSAGRAFFASGKKKMILV